MHSLPSMFGKNAELGDACAVHINGELIGTCALDLVEAAQAFERVTLRAESGPETQSATDDALFFLKKRIEALGESMDQRGSAVGTLVKAFGTSDEQVKREFDKWSKALE